MGAKQAEPSSLGLVWTHVSKCEGLSAGIITLHLGPDS